MLKSKPQYTRLFALLLCCTVVLPVVPRAAASAYDAKPKLVVIVVIDQFRGDYLDRYRADFRGRGFRLFLDHGAYFPDCYYDYANTKTAPGHATLGTGAYSDGHGIANNDWWDLDRNPERMISSVEDPRYRLVGLPDSSIPSKMPGAPPTALDYGIGSSPRNLRASTVGDELRLATAGKSKVFGISLKDRASILPSGQAANAAFWIDPASGRFVTSTYYMADLPAWATAFSTGGRVLQAMKDANAEGTTIFYDLVGRTPAANSYELDFAKALIQGEELGKRGVTDLITVSLSANDILGHQVGPDSSYEKAMVDSLDTDLDGFFSWLDKNVDGGLANVVIALSADHGVAPVPADAARLGINAATLADIQKPGEDRPATDPFAGKLDTGITKPSETRLPPHPVIYRTYTRQQLAAGQYPANEFGQILAHSYSPNGGWYIMVVPAAYQMEYLASIQTTHFSPWSYDRHVPLGFYGAEFVPGIYHGRVAPVDMAATLASLLGINQPSASVGRILTQALKPISPEGPR